MNFNSSDQIISDLKSGHVLPVYILHGPEALFIDEVVAYIESNMLSDAEKAFNQSILYGREVDFKQVLDHARQYPMMSERRVVILKEANYMRGIESLAGYIKNPSLETVFVIAFKTKKIDARSKWFKAAKASDKVGILLSESIKDYKLEKWLSAHLKSKGNKISPQANMLLCEYLGNDLKKLINEVEKIQINMPDNKEITVEEVEKYVGISKTYNVYELLTSLGKKDISRSHQILMNIQDNIQSNPMPMLTSAFYQNFTKIMIVKDAGNMSDGELASKIRVNPYFIRDYKAAAKNFSKDGLKKIMNYVTEADGKSKGVDNRRTEPAELLKELVGKVLMTS